MDRGAWRAAVHGLAKSRIRLSTQLDNGPTTEESPEGFLANNKTRWAYHVLFPFAGSEVA